jgi:hypothetical protein
MVFKKKIVGLAGLIAMGTMSAPAAATVPFLVSTNQASFDAIRNVTNYSITGSSVGTSYTQNGVTFKNSDLGLFTGGFGKNVKYLAANADESASGTPLTITFGGTVLGLTLGSYFCAQTVNYVVNGVKGSITLGDNPSTSFLGFDTGGPSGITVTFYPTRELDIIGFQTAVPEAATWAMMMIGFGAIGFAMRRRPKVATAVNVA